MNKRQEELKYQGHIVKSYAAQGGFAMKWQSDMTSGKPDLVATLPGIGTHLVEVKHLPNFPSNGALVANALRPLQQKVARDYAEAGAMVLAFIVYGGPTVQSTGIAAFWAHIPEWNIHHGHYAGYNKGYDVGSLVRPHAEMWKEIQK